MQFTFLDMAGKTLFIRDDAERAQWTQEEMSLELEFPRLDDKVISIGQRVFFIDPSTGAHQIYEVKQAKTLEPDHYQTVVAENICISELSDEHINNSQVTNVTAQVALQSVLTGTQWSVGTVALNPVSSGDLSRGSAWQAILQIKDNWNVYIEPRVTLSGNGTITRRLDILSPDGTWNGVRLSVDKNMLDPSVTYDDSEVVTAMYGYGGTTTPTTKEEQEVEIDFSGIAWSKTGDHPAKPMGQKYIEDPAATAAYGRNGRARFGFYQNTDIVDPELLLQKTWEALKVASKPAISIDGTVADLYRMGYADEPIKLHDIALVEVLPAGYRQQIQIIKITTDLLDPSSTTLTIGSYIPNIVYIERQTNEQATGSRGGGGGNKSKQTQRSEYETALIKNNRMIMLRAYQNDVDDLDNEVKKQDARITVEANRITQEVTNRREADTELNGKITVEAGKITQIVSAVGKDGEVTAASICLAINDDKSTQATINANKIYLLGQTIANTITADYIASKVASLTILQVKGLGCSSSANISGTLNVAGTIVTPSMTLDGVWVGAAVYNVRITGPTNNVYTLQKQTIEGDGWVDVGTFSRATSLSGSWSGGVLTVTASPQEVEFKRMLVAGGTTWDGHIGTVPIKAAYGGSGQYEESTGWSVTVDGSGAYPHTMTLNQKTNASGAKSFTAYFLNGSTYVSMGQAYWYSSGTNLNVTSKTVRY